MSFLLHQLAQLGMVAVTMVCALFGTVGIIKLIKKFFPIGDFPQGPFDMGKKANRDSSDSKEQK